ncbi:MAG: hypothetical protein ACE5HE_13665, partial [Phycisphaerae bacterium]
YPHVNANSRHSGRRLLLFTQSIKGRLTPPTVRNTSGHASSLNLGLQPAQCFDYRWPISNGRPPM